MLTAVEVAAPVVRLSAGGSLLGQLLGLPLRKLRIDVIRSIGYYVVVFLVVGWGTGRHRIRQSTLVIVA